MCEGGELLMGAMAKDRVCAGCRAPITGHPNRKWCSNRCRQRTLYTGTCLDCGSATYSGDATPPQRCKHCAPGQRRIWTKETVVRAIQAWTRETGTPPTAVDWNAAQAVARRHPEKAEKFHDDDAWPNTASVQAVFGSWSAALGAAGVAPLAQGKHPGDTPIEVCREARLRYESGLSTHQLARTYDKSPGCIADWIRRAGGRLRTHGEAARLLHA